MFGVGASRITHTEIVHDETEDCVSCGVAPEAMGEGAWFVAVGGEFGDELTVG